MRLTEAAALVREQKAERVSRPGKWVIWRGESGAVLERMTGAGRGKTLVVQ